MFHSLTPYEIYKRFNTSPQGLDVEETQKRRAQIGPNTLPRIKKSVFLLLLKQLRSPLIIVLLAAGALSLIIGRALDATIIFISMLISISLGFWQEKKAAKTFEKLNQTLAHHAIILQDGKERRVESDMLVPGDVIILSAGDAVPADARIIEGFSLEINEAALTGEWLTQTKHIRVLPLDTTIPDRSNMAYAGTFVAEGRGKAVVVATGVRTEIGKIAEDISYEEEYSTPLQRDLSHIARIISVAVIFFALAIFGIGVARGFDFGDILLISIAVAVSAVPEGLPAALSVVLAIGMERILKSNGLVRNILATETLGRASLILTDKTGTLTQGKMEVADLLTDFASPRQISKSEGIKKESMENLRTHLALEISTYTTEAFAENLDAPLKEWHVTGRPMEAALLHTALQAGIRHNELLVHNQQLDFLPFNPERRFSASLNENIRTKIRTLYITGAPEALLEHAQFIIKEGKKIIIDKRLRSNVEEYYLNLVSSGKRVIAVGLRETKQKNFSPFRKEIETLLDNLTFIGLISFHDPIRKDVRMAINDARNAGLSPVIITGDHYLTARAVAEELGIKIDEASSVSGKELALLDEGELEKKITHINLFYRTLPRQKKAIVKAWQRKAQVVAMIGDGVNDAPAIKQADVGVATGSGTEVAKEASDLILLNDSFSVIIAAIKQGRIVLDNIKKIIAYLLSTAFSEIILVGGSLLLGLPLPILPAQILWTNIVEEGFQTFSLAFEPGEKDVLKRRPFKERNIFNAEMKKLIFIVGIATDIVLLSLLLLLLHFNYPLSRIRTLMFLGLAIDALFYVFALKNLKKPIWKIDFFNNPFLIFATLLNAILLVLAVEISFLKTLLHTVSPTPQEWMLVIGFGVLNLIAIELGKWFFIHKKEQ